MFVFQQYFTLLKHAAQVLVVVVLETLVIHSRKKNEPFSAMFIKLKFSIFVWMFLIVKKTILPKGKSLDGPELDGSS
jgi:hypothetical protein